KAKAYAPVRDAKLALGLDITRNHVSLVLVDLCGQVLRWKRKSYPFSLDDKYTCGLGELVEQFIADNSAQDRLLGVGISLPGVVAEQKGVLDDSHILGVQDVPTAFFSRYIPYPCRFLNDANAAGLAEVYGTPDAGDLVYLSLSNSVGGAILNGGALYTGAHLRAGEFGHNTLVPGGRRCYCGKEGCLDAYCSARVLADCTEGKLADFFDRLRAGDPQLKQVWQEYLQYLAVAVNNLHMSFDCDVIVGGYVGAYLEEFGGPLRTLLEERNTFRRDASYLRFCRYKLEAAAVGAALMQVDQFIQNI
ncbi:MAG: ROK family protein, partial [Oscillospiraceae bacterium]|nr:ROK family protein [Oscillospiraceae bacterium]